MSRLGVEAHSVLASRVLRLKQVWQIKYEN